MNKPKIITQGVFGMVSITKLTGSPQENWANEKTQTNLKQIINKKHAQIDPETGKIEAGSSKRNCFSKLIHNHKMNNTESSYFAKKVTAAMQAYNAQVEKINVSVKPALVDTAKIQQQIDAAQQNIVAADKIISQNEKKKVALFAPVSAVNSYASDIAKIDGHTKMIEALDKQDAELDLDTTRLNTQNSNLKDKYSLTNGWIFGIRTFNQGGDKEASIKKINEAGYTKNVTAALKKDVCQVIDNDVTLAANVTRKKEIKDDKEDATSDRAKLIQNVKTKIAANDNKVELSSLETYDDIKKAIATLEKEVANQKAAIAKSPEFAACESQINAAKAVKAQALAEIAKLNGEFGVKAAVAQKAVRV
jgi:hypothetical protein